MTSSNLSADHRPTIDPLSADCKNPKTVGRWKKYNKVVIIHFCWPMEKELKSGIILADKSADCWPTVGGVNVIAVLLVKCLCLFFCCFFCFLFSLTSLQRLFHSYRYEPIGRWGETGVPRENHLTHPQADLGLSQIWPVRDSNLHQSQR